MDAWEKIESGLEVFAEPSSNLQNANSFYLSFYGDTIDENDFDGKGGYFSYTTGDENGVERTDYSIILQEHKNQYLAYRSIVSDGVSYGWVELGLNDRGEVVVFSSAQSVSYDGLVVGIGPIPESSCALLTLLGGALLVLRRRRWDSGEKCKPTMP